MADLSRWLRIGTGAFHFTERGWPLAHLTDDELLQRARTLAAQLAPEVCDQVVAELRNGGSR